MVNAEENPPGKISYDPVMQITWVVHLEGFQSE
jgi:hypothetical protein